MNEIIKYDDYAEMIIYDKQGNEKCRTLIDLDDIEKVKDYRWSFKGYVGKGYVKNEKNKLFLHKFIMNAPKGVVVDHINHNKLDNRKSNLRIINKQYISEDFKGIQEKNNKYYSHIKINNKTINLGMYLYKEEAQWARWYAEHILFKNNKKEPFIIKDRKIAIKRYVNKKVQRL